MDETGMVVTAFVFILLVVILTSFFVITGDNVDLVGQYKDEYGIPFAPIYSSDDIEYDEDGVPITEGNSDSGNIWAVVLGEIILIGSILLAPFTAGTSLLIPVGGIIAGGMLWYAGSPSSTQAVLNNLPVIGNIFGGINYVATAIGSFGKLVFYSNPIIETIPFLNVLIVAPIILIFFIFTVHIIRGN